MSTQRILSLLLAAFALTSAHAGQPTAALPDAVTQGGKITKADAARTAAPATPAAPAAPGDDAQLQRGIEKKDIRRGMVISKPGSITPHTRTSRPIECPPCDTLSATPNASSRD
ncbi:MAG: hypothetical protein ACP5F9_05460 [Thiomonas sp.]